MAKQVSIYFHRRAKGDDLSALKETHRQQFPGNELAVLPGALDSILVKVAYLIGTVQPLGTLTAEEAKAEITVVSTALTTVGPTA